jgi:exodeoxyribonuclease VII small subunit
VPSAGDVGAPGLTTIALSKFRMARKADTIPAAALPPPASYEDALSELERLVADMEGGQMPLDRLVEGYRRGAELLGYCRSRLDAVEEQVKVLEEGQLKPWIAG